MEWPIIKYQLSIKFQLLNSQIRAKKTGLRCRQPFETTILSRVQGWGSIQLPIRYSECEPFGHAHQNRPRDDRNPSSFPRTSQR